MEGKIDTDLIAAFETIAGTKSDEDTLRADLEALAKLLDEVPAKLDAPSLVFRGRDGAVRVVPVGEELSCGRGVGCQLRFPELREISRRHFTVVKEENIYWLRDQGSFNGTKIRGRPVKNHELRNGDLINAAGIIFGFVRE